MRIWAIRVAALAILLLLALLAALGSRTLSRLPDTVVYFVQSDEATFHLERAYRRTVRGDPEALARAAVEALVDGPTGAERAQGLSSAFPPELEVLGAELEAGVLAIDLSGAFERGGGTALMRARLAQLFYTLSQPAGVDAVALYVEGSPVHVFGGEGILIEQPWYRADHPELPVW